MKHSSRVSSYEGWELGSLRIAGDAGRDQCCINDFPMWWGWAVNNMSVLSLEGLVMMRTS